jgi:outer membrane protein assembly factor BamB
MIDSRRTRIGFWVLATVLFSWGSILDSPSFADSHRPAYHPYATVHGDNLYVQTQPGRLVSLNLEKRTVNWRFEDHAGELLVPGDLVADTLAVALIHGSRKASILGLDPSNGRKKWGRDFDELGGNPVPIVCDEKILVTQLRSGNTEAVSIESGGTMWRLNPESFRLYNPPSVREKEAFLMASRRTPSNSKEKLLVVRINCENGRVVNEMEIDGEGISRRPTLLSDGDLITSTSLPHGRGSILASLQVDSGRKNWEHEFSSSMTRFPILAGGRLFFGAPEVLCLDVTSGKVVFRKKLGRGTESLTIAGTVLVIHDGSGYVQGIEAKTGKTIWKTQIKSISSNLQTWKGLICLVGEGAKVLLMDSATGRTITRIALNQYPIRD